MKKIIGKILSSLGLLYCSKCGGNKVVYREHGFYEEVDYICPVCKE